MAPALFFRSLLTPDAVRFEAFVVLLEFWLGLTVRYRLSSPQRVKSPSIGFVGNLLLSGSLRFEHLLFAFNPNPTGRRMTSARRGQVVLTCEPPVS